MAQKLDLTKHHQIHGRQYSEAVALQDGKLYSLRGERLGTDLERINQKGFAVTGPLRQEMTRQSNVKKLQDDYRKNQAALEAQMKAEQLALEKEINRLEEEMQQAEVLPIEPLPSEPKVQPLGLLPVERKAALQNQHYDELADQEEDDEPTEGISEALLSDEVEETPEEAVAKLTSNKRKRV